MSTIEWRETTPRGVAIGDDHEALTFHELPAAQPALGVALCSCECGVRAAADCPGAWEPGCDLGANPEHARPVPLDPSNITVVRPRVIGLTGVARSGKDTVARYLVEQHGFVQHSFAAPIRQFVANILGWSLEELEARKEEQIEWLVPTPPVAGRLTTPRWLMQTVGTEWGRQMIDPDLWVKACMQRVQHDLDAGRSVVISDVRFNNEAEVILARGGAVWQMLRNAAGTPSTHKSENGVDPGLVTRFVPNNSTMAMLFVAVEATLAHGEVDAS